MFVCGVIIFIISHTTMLHSRLWLWSICFLSLVSAAESKDELVIGGYLPEYRSYINVNRTAPYLTDLIIFSVTSNWEGNLGKCCLEAHHFQQAREAQAAAALKKRDPATSGNQKLKLWVSVGGAGRSEALPLVASDPERRSRLLSTLIALCKKEGLDGVDFDWEMPQNEKESKDYISLLVEASKALHDAGILVSVALHPFQIYPKYVFDAVDRVHLMTYDMATVGTHHASPDKMENAVQALLEGGCPSNKVVVGIPAYARHGQNSGMVKTFSECVDEMESPTPKELNKGEWNGYFYDSPKLVRYKVSWAQKHGLRGLFFWELGQDKQHETLGPGGILVKAAFKQKVKIIQSSKASASSEHIEL